MFLSLSLSLSLSLELVDATLYSQLVELIDAMPDGDPLGRSYAEMCVDGTTARRRPRGGAARALSAALACARPTDRPLPPPSPKPKTNRYRDVRAAVDLCHRDGVIKDRVAEDPAAYVLPDPDMVPMLEVRRARVVFTRSKSCCVVSYATSERSAAV